jgi:hypothetical protein
MASTRNNFAAFLLASLLAFIAIDYLAVENVRDRRGQALLRHVLDWLDRFEEGHLLPLYTDKGNSGHKLKKD